MDELIHKLFTENWCGGGVTKNLQTMKKQLYKTLKDQTAGYWSGSTAYHIVTYGGFLKDAKKETKKELTELGKMFIKEYEKEQK